MLETTLGGAIWPKRREAAVAGWNQQRAEFEQRGATPALKPAVGNLELLRAASTALNLQTVSMLADGTDTFIISDTRTFIRVLPGGVEAVVGAHGVMSEKLPSVGSICSGICQTQRETINTRTQHRDYTSSTPGPGLGLRRAAGRTMTEVKLCCISEI